MSGWKWNFGKLIFCTVLLPTAIGCGKAKRAIDAGGVYVNQSREYREEVSLQTNGVAIHRFLKNGQLIKEERIKWWFNESQYAVYLQPFTEYYNTENKAINESGRLISTSFLVPPSRADKIDSLSASVFFEYMLRRTNAVINSVEKRE